MSQFFWFVKSKLHQYFNLEEDKADEDEIVASITKGIHFKGINLWTLAFAIFIASIGLNVNSTAVIIGAMLISPLMGPIMGIGLGIGINDLDLVKRALANLFVAVLISVGVSTLYFKITPLHEAQSELLARTMPTIWDVFIAFVGGLAGIVAGTRKEKTNVIPGVAIATALMPPLCTAGFGLATGNISYFFGAFYLFFINSVFICLSTFLIVRYLKFKRKQFEDPGREKRLTRTMALLVFITIVPSIYLAYRIVRQSVFEAAANTYVREEFTFPNTQVVNKSFIFEGPKPTIDLLLIGEELNKATLDTLRSHLTKYKLDSTRLVVHQGWNARKEIDFTQIKASIMAEVLQSRPPDTTQQVSMTPALLPEIKTLFPDIRSYSISRAVFITVDSARKDSLTLFIAQSPKRMPASERTKLEQWLKLKLQADSVRVLDEITR